jgi:hypothetical protein
MHSRTTPNGALTIAYSSLDFSDLRETTLADLLVNLEADLVISGSQGVIYSERAFPVVELARALALWIRPQGPSGDFRFSSMSFEEPGSVTIERSDDGWVLYSAFTPDVRSSLVDRSDIAVLLSGFISDVRSDLAANSLDPAVIPALMDK